ncbi:MAG: glycerol-3-phosphate acyltransferase [Chloroflexota bacterium]
MEIVLTALLAVAAFGLGAVPFSLLVGRVFLGKDIRDYGDGNPGAANVFRAGGQKSGYLAVFLDVAKGVPVVFLAHAWFGLPIAAVVIIALAAVLGHAFSPFLGWRGGKAVAVTFGVLLALPQYELLLVLIVFVVLGALFIEVDAWTVIFGAAGSLAYLAVTRGGSWEPLMMLGILAILAFKHFDELHNFPGFRGRLVRWVQAVIRGTQFIV